MPRNTNKNIQNFKTWFRLMVCNENVQNENLDDVYYRALYVRYLVFDKFKCDPDNEKNYFFMQTTILQRLNEMNDIDRKKELEAILNDTNHYTDAENCKAEDELGAIVEDTAHLLKLSAGIWKAHTRDTPCFITQDKNHNFNFHQF